MMKIAYYLENKTIANLDLSNPELGNPGCGGTEYLFVAAPYYLAKNFSEKYEVHLIANVIDKLPSKLSIHQALDTYSAIRKAKEINADIFIYRPKHKENKSVINLIDSLKVKTIGWAHITPSPPIA